MTSFEALDLATPEVRPSCNFLVHKPLSYITLCKK